ncbi:SPFH/Band 7/PHB domain protein [Aquiluna sp.]|jgi:regulator of protease activity HflC (stomatin/prohibitin superfamily)|nr:SPFH domain-containing protein [Aquiluna sp.]MDA9099590.1 SPFH/Band 7/PHB domain protein [Aquiluna sp.]
MLDILNSFDFGSLVTAVVLIVIALLLIRSIRIIPQATAGVVERLGRFHKVLNAGVNLVFPFIDVVRRTIDLREQVVDFQPQSVITEDNLVVSIDTVIYYQVTDSKSATYEINNFVLGIEQLTVTTLRNVVGSLDLESALTSRETINKALRTVLDEATGKWGVRVNRVEIRDIVPPESVRDSMEKQMKAEREKRASILLAEGTKQAAILTAEGNKQADILRAEGSAKAMVLNARADAESQALVADGESQAIQKVFDALSEAAVTDQALAYKYIDQLKDLAQGDANKVWFIPTELSAAASALARAFATKK